MILLTAAMLSTSPMVANARPRKADTKPTHPSPATTPNPDDSNSTPTAKDEPAKKVGDDGVSATLPPPPGSAVTKGGGRLLYLEIDSDLVRPRTHRHPARQVVVYTPAGYDAPEHARERYPVLYLLHGAPGYPTDFIEYGDWPALSEKASVETGAVAPIMVMPDGNYTGEKHGDSEWANSADGRDRFEDFIVQEIVPFTDRRFRTIQTSSGRMIGGVSEGGYGCVNLALHHPDLFGGAIALSGYFDNGGFGWARKVLGHDGEHLRSNNPLGYLDTGLPSGEGPREWRSVRFFLGVGANEKRYTSETVRLADKLKSIGAPTTLRMQEGKHGWELWNQLYFDGIKSMLTPQRAGIAEKEPQP